MEVLVVEDDSEIRQVVRFVLGDAGIDVVEAATGRDALRRATERPVDLVILDIGLPDMSGLDVLTELRRLDTRLHVILLTAAGSETDRVQGFAIGADDYVVKPFSVRELVARVEAVQRRLDAAPPTPTVATAVIVGSVVRYVDAAMVQLLGAAAADQLNGREWMEFVAPESVGSAMARYKRVQTGETPRPELLALRRIDGETTLVELSSALVSWGGGPATQITLRERAHVSGDLRDVAADLGGALHDAVLVTSGDLVVQSCNPAAEELYGWREADVVGRHVFDAVPPDDEHHLDGLLRRLAVEGRWRGEIVARRADGSRVRVQASVTVLRGSDGSTVGMIWVQRPVEQYANGRAGGLGLDDEIRVGIERGEFTVHYQPIVRLGDASPLGAEALARWEHPERGLVPPAGFIAAAERSGAIVELGQVVLERACQQWQAWHRAGRDLHVAVNLSGRQLAEPSLPDRLADAMSLASMPPGALWLEVTETSLVEDVDRARAALRQVAELGAVVSIDDFGTGWASLTYLREFPVHAIKIDRLFVEGLGTGGRDAAIVSSMISLGRDLDLAVVAEGVETDEQRQRLIDAGCVLGQGYYFGRPVAAHALAFDG